MVRRVYGFGSTFFGAISLVASILGAMSAPGTAQADPPASKCSCTVNNAYCPGAPGNPAGCSTYACNNKKCT
jgi:hypothetical protein